MSKKRVGFIGLGLMGGPMAANIARAGYPLSVYNRSADKARGLVEIGAEPAETPSQVAARSDVVITMLSDAAAVEQVLRGEEGLLAGGHDGEVLIDMSTVSPEQSRSIAIEVESRGWRKLEAPVYGSTGPARDGTLGILVGGDEALFREQHDLFSVLGRDIFYLGPMGAGTVTKLAFNLMVAAQVASLGEAISLASKGGVDPRQFGDVLLKTAVASDLVKRKLKNVVEGDFTAAFPLKHMHKDLGLMVDTGHSIGAPLPGTGAIHELFTAATARGYGDQDAIAIYCLLAELAGLSPVTSSPH